MLVSITTFLHDEKRPYEWINSVGIIIFNMSYTFILSDNQFSLKSEIFSAVITIRHCLPK